MKINSISGLGSEIIASIMNNSKLECLADEMRRKVRYFNVTGSKIPEMNKKAREEAVIACKAYCDEGLYSAAAKNKDLTLCLSFLKKHDKFAQN